ncbi:hypothetical protein NL676_036926 [Syzygium grande]|nr:hypothetical protein NL676_036926 [Syzygium grande]
MPQIHVVSEESSVAKITSSSTDSQPADRATPTTPPHQRSLSITATNSPTARHLFIDSTVTTHNVVVVIPTGGRPTTTAERQVTEVTVPVSLNTTRPRAHLTSLPPPESAVSSGEGRRGASRLSLLLAYHQELFEPRVGIRSRVTPA